MSHPNIVYILFDDLGYGDVSALNERAGFQTPAFDRIAKEGIAFTDAHSSSAVCTPSRYSIITGRYNWRSRLKSFVLGGFSEPLIDSTTPTVGRMLQSHGYSTHLVGKWHLGLGLGKEEGFVEAPNFGDSEKVDYSEPITDGPLQRGFDTFFGISASLDMPPYAYIKDDRFTSIPKEVTSNTGMSFWRKGVTADDFVHNEVLDRLATEAEAIIEADHQNPFFLLLSLTGPHTPILPKAEFVGSSKTNAYGDFVLHCDQVVGRVLDALDTAGIATDTLVLLTSDNGCSPEADFAALQAAGHNPSYIFRGMKSDIYEGGHRIPLLIRWPERIKAGQTSERIVSLVDLYATLADLLEHQRAEDEAVDSYSMLPLFDDPSAEEVRPSLVHQSIDGSLSLRKDRWKLQMCPGSGGWSAPQPGSKEEEGLPAVQLYDLVSDIGETTNLQDRYPERVQAMRAELAEIVRRGRSTEGKEQPNDGVAVWESVDWLDD